MTFGDELSLTHCGTSHFKLFSNMSKVSILTKVMGFGY